VNPSPLPQKRAPVSRFPNDRLGDAELVQAVVRGDVDAVGVVWDRYSALVRSVLRGSLGPDSGVEDLLQEVFIVFLRCARDLRDANALRAFLIAVAVRLVTVELRRRRVRRWVTLSPNDEMPDSSVMPRDFAGLETLRGLYRILGRMPHRRRLAFVLRNVQGLEITEVAKALDVSESTAKREIARAKEVIQVRSRGEPALWQYLKSLEGGSHA
jgi:RNA polymerase sigma-70 factor (ECF subfamily)